MIDVAAQRVIKSIQVGELPWGVAIMDQACRQSSPSCPRRGPSLPSEHRSGREAADKRNVQRAVTPPPRSRSIISATPMGRGRRWTTSPSRSLPATLHGAARPQRRRQDARCSRWSPGSSAPSAGAIRVFGHDVVARARRGAAPARRRVPGAHARSRSLRRAEPRLSRRPARYRPPARRARAPRRLLGTRRPCRSRAATRCASLSGGQMRRLEIARALLHRPRLVCCSTSRPSGSTSPPAPIFSPMCARLVAESGVAVLWATHLIDEVCRGRSTSSCCIGAGCSPTAGVATSSPRPGARRHPAPPSRR